MVLIALAFSAASTNEMALNGVHIDGEPHRHQLVGVP
jgi:hypothetical protein